MCLFICQAAADDDSTEDDSFDTYAEATAAGFSWLAQSHHFLQSRNLPWSCRAWPYPKYLKPQVFETSIFLVRLSHASNQEEAAKKLGYTGLVLKVAGPQDLLSSTEPTSGRAAAAQAGAYLQQVKLSPQENPTEVFNNLCSFLGEAKENLDLNEFSKDFLETFVSKHGVYFWM